MGKYERQTLEATEAIEQLAKSEAGRDALFYIQAWLDDTGLMLDSINQASCVQLLMLAWHGSASTVGDTITRVLQMYSGQIAAQNLLLDSRRTHQSTGARRMDPETGR
jgi:hypothetical protein